MSARLFGVVIFVGVAIRLAVLPLPGTRDVGVWKIWTYNAARHSPLRLYGVGGSPPDRRVLEFHGAETTVDYPPVTLYELAIVGRIYGLLYPSFPDTAALTSAIKLLLLAFEVGFAVLMYLTVRSLTGPAQARWAVSAYALNPAPLVGSSMLAYLDPLVVWPLAGALVTASGGWPFVSGALFAVAAATKAQGLFALPAVALAVWCGARADDRLRSLWRCAAAALAAVAAIVAPIAAVGSLGNLLAALESLARHDMLSANAPNLWWIVAYLLRGWYAKANMGTWAAFTTPTRILGISRTMELGYPNPRLVGAALTMAAMCWALWTARRTRDRLMLVGVGAFMVHAYATLSAQVHENHLYAAIPLMIFAAAGHPRLRPVMWTVSLVFAVNLNAFYGISEYIEGWAISRTITVIDLTVLLAAVNCAALVWHAQVLRRECRETQTDTARLNSLPPVARLIRIIS